MKILLLQDRLRSGGTERQSVLLAGAFAAAGHATTLLTFRPGGALAATVDAAVSRRALQPFDTGLDWFAPGLRRAVAGLRPAVVLCMGRMANCYAGSLQRLALGERDAPAVVATMRTGKSLPRLFRRSLAQVRHVVANSRAAKENLVAQYRVPPEKISVIHNSLVFPAESGGGRNEALRAQWGAGPGTIVLLDVAMFRPEKNQRELIELVAALPRGRGVHLWLAGVGPALEACRRRVAEQRWDSFVKFLGFQPDPSPLYAAADLAVHASYSESLSNFLIEAQAHGLPSVAYDAQGIDECCVPGETGFVIPAGDRAAFLAALERLVAEPAAVRARRAAGARAYARTTFDPQRQVAAYLRLFETLAAGQPP
ncbi:MAG TPA: glycosyltransferase [Opitutaceae bacterium]|nr:glycosyltransferase [Opitutaceae bacterium]